MGTVLRRGLSTAPVAACSNVTDEGPEPFRMVEAISAHVAEVNR